ncbi:lamin tail domain-containing protein [Enteractinococcus coprophilus]|uniref:Lamin tail-like protein n=1 Tax=Enteractinococcus coprophilus TaxID=1027633 RepID=A0A543AFM1_9MICC|nr:lamin tail domain-containing protein [Enteractinococcus coprophilus]TQL71363.1 lamin tail-like protein [Enteractinococcus coprophilus]
MPPKPLGGRFTALSAACLVALSPFAMSSAAAMPIHPATTVQDVQQQPSGLVVTEIVPDTTGHDHFEYFEIHNASDAPIDLDDAGYSFAYSYVDSADQTRDVALNIHAGEEPVVLAPGETAIMWLSYTSDTVNSYAYTVDDFRAFYDMADDNNARIVRVEGQAGMANGGSRGIRVLQNGAVDSWSFYPTGSPGVQQGVEFGRATSGEQPSRVVLAQQAAPTPGQVRDEQLSLEPVEPEEPEEPEEPTDPFGDRQAPSTAAELMLTELVVDSANVGESDGYEFIEIANPTDTAISVSDYTINYLYPDSGSNALWAATPSNVVIAPGQTLVYWIKNGANNDLTTDDFNEFYGTELVLGETLTEIYSGGMANGSARGIQIETNTGFAINTGHYNMNGVRDVQTDQGLYFGVDDEDLQNQHLWGSADPTPGALHPAQAPESAVQLTADDTDPQVEDNTVDTIDPDEGLAFTARITDDVQVKTVTLNLQSNADETAQQIVLRAADDDTYTHEVPEADLTGKRWYDYSFTVSDGTNDITTDPQRVTADGVSDAPVRLNLEADQWVTGTTAVIGASDSLEDQVELAIDGDAVETEASLEAEPVFAFETTQTDAYFRNGVLAGDDILEIFDKGTYQNVETISTAVPLDYITDERDVTLSIYAGTKAAPEIDPDENNDDFRIRNPRLILPDGRTLTPAGLDDPQAWMDMGDSAGKLEFYDAQFDIPDDAFTGAAHQWDTTASDDGDHSVTAALSDGDDSVTRNVQVDNTGPQIEVTGVENDQPARGEFTLDATVEDAGVGVANVAATLNGENIELPYATSSVTLDAGEHTFEVTATDELGNEADHTVTFTTPKEHPFIGELTPSDNATVAPGDVELSAQVDDPSGDSVDATFYGGLRPSLDSEAVRASSGTVTDAATLDRADAKPLSEEDIEAMTTLDGLNADVESDSKFPYQLFEVDVPDDAVDGSEVRLNWHGSAEPDAQVALYALDAQGTGWDEIDRHVTGETQDATRGIAAAVHRAFAESTGAESFSLDGVIDAEQYADDGTVTVLVQHSDGFAGQDFTTRESAVEPAHADDVDRAEYDFTFAWESDTQYYNEDFPHHQTAIHDYVLAERENKNIQFLFHTGDVIDEKDKAYQWENADPEYRRLDEAGLPYSILAGNHDVVLNSEVDYTTFSQYFGADRYADNPWYAGTYEDNRGSYHLFSAGGIDFIVVAMGWDPGDAEIAWMNQVLAAHPDRVGIVNLHEYMLTTGGLGPVPQRILDEVIATNPNVSMVMSGHYHDAYTRTDDFDDDGDGQTDRTVTSMLFDYQGLPEGGQGFLRLLHFDNEGQRMLVRTYSPSLDQYNSDDPTLLVDGDDPYADQQFEISYEQLGIEPAARQLATDAFTAEVLTDAPIGTVEDIATPGTASIVWKDRDAGEHSWYVRVSDDFGGSVASPVMTFTAENAEDESDDGETNDDNTDDENSSGNGGTPGGTPVGDDEQPVTGDGSADDTNPVETPNADPVDDAASGSDDQVSDERADGNLADTGASAALGWLIGGGVLALAVGSAMVWRRRTGSQQ